MCKAGVLLLGSTVGRAYGERVYDNGRILIRVMNPSGAGGSRFTDFNKFYRFISISKF